VLLQDILVQIGAFDTCMIANAIEQFGVRMRSEGFARSGACQSTDFSAERLRDSVAFTDNQERR